MEFFVFRLNKLKILNNREWGKGELKLLSFITGDDVNLPSLESSWNLEDIHTRKEHYKKIARSLVSNKVLIQLDNVQDGHKATFGDTGYALYTSDKIPLSFNWSLIVLEIDQDIRELGSKIDSVVDSEGFDSFIENTLLATGTVANPIAGSGVAIAKYIFGKISGLMMNNSDDQIGLAYQSFNRFEHYPHGERKRDDVPDLSNNLRIDYSIFGTVY